MKSILGGIIGGVIVAIIVLGVIIVMPTELVEVQNIVKEESMNPCQKAVIDNFKLAQELAILHQNEIATQEELNKFAEEMPIKQAGYKQKLIDNDCMNMDAAKSGLFIPHGDWYTLEFQNKIQRMLDAGL